jgi:hypothetical protein
MPQHRVPVVLGDGSITKLKLRSVRKHLAAGDGKFDADGIFVFKQNPKPPADRLAQALEQLVIRRSTPPGRMQSPTIIVLRSPTPQYFLDAYHGLPPGQRYPTPLGGMGELMPNGKRSQHPALARDGAGL